MGKATARARHGSYLFQRPGSSNWWVRLRSPDQTIVKSLGTGDKLQAEVVAHPMIAEHKARLLAARPRFDTVWQHKLEPGREHAAPDGGKIVATDKELIHIGHNGAVTLIEPNGGTAYQLVGAALTVGALAEATLAADFGGGRGERTKAPTRCNDDGILEAYIKNANITGHFENEARSVWALFRSLCDKPLKDCDRDDGRKLVVHYEAQELKSATIRKKVGWLTAAVNLAIKDRKDGDPLKLKFNPFSSIVPDREDSEKRQILSDADMKAIKQSRDEDGKLNFDKLSADDQLLFRLLATTGMRLSEAFEIGHVVKVKIKKEWREQINRDKTDFGIRYITVGHKTAQSLRDVPFPAPLLPYLPKPITGQLFPLGEGGTIKSAAAAASKRLNRFLRDCGIDDPRKVLHSLRHRAIRRLRDLECPDATRYALFGHEDETVSAGYGEGVSVKTLKKWADKIGF